MSKIKPVKAWGLLLGDKLTNYAWPERMYAVSRAVLIAERSPKSAKAIRVEIRPVTPKKKVRK